MLRDNNQKGPAMILGMSVADFTRFHVILSLVGMVSGIVVVRAMLRAHVLPVMTSIFLTTTMATSVTGFLFPIAAFGPPEIVGVISIIILGLAMLALYVYRLAGSWRMIYVVSAVLALYLNVFVGVVQAFQKVPFFHALAPTQKEAPFAIAQAAVLLVFAALGAAAAKKFRPLGRPPAFA